MRNPNCRAVLAHCKLRGRFLNLTILSHAFLAARTHGQVTKTARRIASLRMPPVAAAPASSGSVTAVANPVASTAASVARNASASTTPGRRLELFEATRRRIRRLQKQASRQGGAPSPASGVKRFEAGACSFDRRLATNLNRLLTLDGEEQRCAVRHVTLEQAGKACAARAECVGIVRDHGLRCADRIHQFELRGGYPMPQRGHVSWVCASHYKAPVGRVAASAKGAKAGFVFTLLGRSA